MLHVLVGNDFNKIKGKTAIHAGDFERTLFSTEDLVYDELDARISSGGLFNQKQVIILKDCLTDHENVLLKRLEAMSNSSNIFIIIETKILKKERTKIEKFSYSYDEFKLIGGKQEDKSLFELADYLGNKDKKNMWLLYRRFVKEGKKLEEIQGVLWWEIKTLLLIKNSTANPGLHPFVFDKNKRASEKFSILELQMLAKKIVDIHHKTRGGEIDMEIGLERFILEF